MKKKIIFIITICLLFNNLICQGIVEASIHTSSSVVKVDIFQAVTFARLPFTVMNDLLSGVPLLPQYKQPAKNPNRNNDNDSRSNKYDLVLNCSEELGVSLRTAGKILLRTISNNSETSVFRTPFISLELLNTDFSPDSPQGFVCVILLVYLVLLSKGNLPVDIFAFLSQKSPAAFKRDRAFSFATDVFGLKHGY